jgi:colanic acid biosynthesis glycosyl transferase WcaI
VRIAVCGYNYAPESVGIGRYTGEACEWLALRGHDVRVITSFPYYPAWRVDAAYRGRVITTERPSAHLGVVRVAMFVPPRPTGAKRMVQELSFAAAASLPLAATISWRPQAVIAICPPLLAAIPALFLARATGSPLWLHVQDLQVDAAAGLGLLPRPLRSALVWLETVLLESSYPSTISKPMRDRLEAKGPGIERVALVPNWASVRAAHPEREREWRVRNGFLPEEHLLLYAGNLGLKQGLEVLADIARRLQGVPGVRLVIAGDGAGREYLAQATHGLRNVTWLPLQAEEDLAAMLSAAVLHLVPQRSDAADLVLPSKLANILSCGGVAVVSGAKGTALHELHEAGVVVAVRPQDASAFVTAVEALLAQPERRAAIAARAASYAAACLDRDEILTHWERLIEGSVQRTKDSAALTGGGLAT